MTNIITAMTALGQFISWASPIVGAITNPIIKARRFVMMFIMTVFVVFFIASSYAADGDGGVDIDTDNDNFTDAIDVDDDGDGLIEIATVAQLNQVRHNLLGSSLKASARSEGNATGCGGQDGITECNGYELAANISLADYANWQPIGSCPNYDASSRRCENRAALFNAIFDGNDYTISNLNIANPIGDYANGAGLFGAISPAAVLRNIHIRSANISGGSKNVGLLVGYAQGANIANSSAAGEVSGTNRVGGLVGDGYAATITSSYTAIDSVSGHYNVGGLVGYGEYAKITSSYALVGSVRGAYRVGGLVGNGRYAKISSSYASGGSISGSSDVGGLVGRGAEATISSSYASGGSVSGDDYVGGLVGYGSTGTNVFDSYWDSEISGMTTGSYGKPKTTSELQSITSFEGIYASWVENKCADDSQAWNLGTNFQYPALTCTPGELTDQRSYATAQHTYAVTGLRVIPGDGNATLSWNNPYAQIASISISYQRIGSDGVQYLPLIKDSAKTSANAIDAQQIISGLINGKSYTFTVDLTLRGIYAGKEGIAPSITVAIGPNYDGDDLVNFVDHDDDNDGIEDNADACNEAGAATNWISNKSTDFDGDGCRNSDEDVDDNGNGLIEIHNAWELDQVREDLNGRSFAGDSTGCGGQNTGITACNGYELTANISLADYANWQPIGSCSNYDASSRRCENRGVLFNVTFDGNGYTISNLTITNPTGDYAKAVGLFGAISPTSVLRNIHIRSANISGGGNNVGLLVGYAREASIMNSSAAGEVTAHGDNIGGLVGSGEYMTITSSYATGSYVSGGSNVGGLVGYGWRATIISSYILGGDIIGADNVGGLVGNGAIAHITYSYAAGGDVSGQIRIGGLVGSGGYATISSSYAAGGSVSGDINVGGLVGAGWYAAITSSYAAYDDVGGDEYVGGLVGRGNDATAVSFSYWDSEISGMATGSYGKPKTTSELQSITSFEGIYASWVENKCADDSQAWNLGTNFQYPALTCTPGELTDQRSNAVTGLRVIPGDGKATLIWNNPYAQIASISISYKKTGSDDAPITESSKRITADAKNVQETIKELTNGESYTFTVSLILRGVHAGKEGTAPSVTAAIGPNYDGDDLVNFVDHDDDNDGVEDNADACNEAGAATNWISNKNTDYDGDGCRNSDEDVDDNGNGLIEIHNAWELDQVREDLNGRSFAGDSTGCGGQNTGITACNGYELTANISLADYANWQPIGSCSNYDASSRRCENRGVLFNVTFDGNGYTISNLTITNPTGDYAKAVGLFGAISPTSVLRNIHIRSANISGGGNNVGLLVGYAREASIMNSSAAGEVTAHGDNIGGLVGSGEYMTITSSYATGSYVSGGSNVGGLVGYGWRATIISSYILGGDIIGADNVGGLVGNGAIAHITYSYAAGGDVSGQIRIGGLVGSGGYATISSSYAAGGSVSGDINVGGLVGAGWYAAITSSYAAYDDVGGDEYVGGLVGRGNDATAVSFSYWDSEISGMTTGSYGKPKTTSELQSITSFEGIYASWVENKCADDSQAWNLGTNFQYPALTCTPGELTDQRSYATAQRTYAVTGLRVIPGDGNATLSWNNPYAQIASISISYQRIGSDGVQYLPLIKDSAKTSANAIDAQQIISGLTNGKSYTFTVDLTLRGIYAGKEGIAPSITVAIGPNYDGDDLVNFVDHDDDNDGIEDNADACNEAGAATNWISNKSTDFDGDGCRNSDEDVDDNGNGLIEIHNAWELDQVREDLNGRSFAGDSAGCGGQNTGITACNGYELAANIDLSDYGNWEPIGDEANPLTGSFDGNGYNISGLSSSDYQYAGLFGYVENANIRNTGVMVGNISASSIIDNSYAGGLIGRASNSQISNSYAVIDGDISSTSNSRSRSGSSSSSYPPNSYAGGLIGLADDSDISNSYAVVDGDISSRSISRSSFYPRSYAGGLVGRTVGREISNSYAVVVGSIYSSSSGSLSRSYTGGLVGWAGGEISNSYAVVAAGISSSSYGSYVGGLVGWADGSPISNSYAVIVGYIFPNGASVYPAYAGGLVGWSDGSEIINSYYSARRKSLRRDFTNTLGTFKTIAELSALTAASTGWNGAIWYLGANDDLPTLRSLPSPDVTLLLAPGDVAVTALDLTVIEISWNSIPGFASYEVHNEGGLIATIDHPVMSYNATGLSPNTQYTYRVRACNFSDCLDFVSATTTTLKSISSAAELAAIGDDKTSLSGNYILTGNIDLSGRSIWKPIGDRTNAFTGSFDGNGYKISGLSSSGYQYAGLFGVVRDASISNLGVLVGDISTSSRFSTYAGGLIGSTISSKVINSYAIIAGNISASSVGGLIGRSHNSQIDNSYAEVVGDISAIATSSSSYAGGLLGYAYRVNQISNSYASVVGDISASSRSTSYAGGLVGRTDTDSPVINSYASVLGGISSYSSSGYVSAGGLVGNVYNSQVINSYAVVMDDISAITTSSLGHGSSAGGLIGGGYRVIQISGSYYSTSRVSSRRGFGNTYGTSRTIAQLSALTAATTNWDETIWNFGTSHDLPTLRSLPSPYIAPTPVPSTPTGVTARELSASSIRISWISVSNVNATSYQVHDSDGLAMTIDAPATSHTAINLSPNTRYTYRIRACNLSGCSDLSAGASATTRVLIVISDADEFRDISASEYALSSSYTLTGNIDLSGYDNWQPIGNRTNPFTGSFNGNGYNISGISSSGYQYAGLFGYIAGASISNLGVMVGSISASPTSNSPSFRTSYAGGLVGYADFSEITNSYTVVSNNIDSFSYYSSSSAGGLVGTSYSSEIINSSAIVARNIYSSASYAGGLVGSASYGKIINSYAEVMGDISSSSSSGGIAAYTFSVDISSSYAVVGGGIYSRSAGGLVGYLHFSEVMNSYAEVTRDISSSSSSSSFRTNSGGLFGRADGSRINNSYVVVTGRISSSSLPISYAGGLVGRVVSTISISKSYYSARRTSSQGGFTNTHGTPRTVAELRVLTAGITGWDESIWNFGTSNDLPTLRSSPFANIAPSPTLVPSIPTGVTARELSSSSIRISWDSVLGATSYQVHDSEALIMTINPPATRYAAIGLSSSTTYTYRIRACNLFGCSDLSARVSATTTATIDMIDTDGDGIGDNLDVDDDGNGLIEIGSANALNMVRYNLAGTSFRTSTDASSGNDIGCGGQPGISSCNGYELTADIFITGYLDWNPIGSCIGQNFCLSEHSFSGVFAGNGHTVSNLTIVASNYDYGVGLFGSVSGIIRDLGIVDISISGSGNYVGALVGFANDAIVDKSYVVSGTVSGDDFVGALVGASRGSTIVNNSFSVVESVSGDDYVGGFAGSGRVVANSYAEVASVRGSFYVGGLAGSANIVTNSYAKVTSVRGSSGTGGLIGRGTGVTISNSYAIIEDIGNHHSVGGLVGDGSVGGGTTATIINSYAVVSSLSSRVFNFPTAGGLVGDGADIISNSYYNIATIVRGNVRYNLALSRTIGVLQEPISATGIYVNWGGVCDGTNNPIWDFGTSSQYPALTCTPNYDSDREGVSDITDTDSDGIGDNADVDDDGDGLIEIATAEQLNQVRYNLLGSSFKASAGDAGTSTGCGGLNGITECNGYELVADISLVGYNDDNWRPIGNTFNAFTGNFDGNGYKISGLSSSGYQYAGLFGYVENANIRNIGVLVDSISASISAGGLAGGADNSQISNSYAVVAGDISVSAPISASFAAGLVGLADSSPISNSYAIVRGNIYSSSSPSSSWAGGLIGSALRSPVSNSYAVVVGDIYSDGYAGGLVGGASYNSNIINSYAVAVGDISSVYSSAMSEDLRGASIAGRSSVRNSYWDSAISVSSQGMLINTFANSKTFDWLRELTADAAGWDDTIWNFGTDDDFPTLRSLPVPDIFLLFSVDYDGDGIPDFIDLDANGDGKVDIDTDGDGILDYVDTDDDNDNYFDTLDVDDDGDGLIEIATAEQLNQIRHNLRGSSLKASAGDQGSNTGCGNGRDIKACNGYELTADISLAGYENWEPIGSCSAYSYITCTPVSALFNTIFDGNDYTISNLTITNPAAPYTNGAGLFGAISSASILRNIHIRSAYISGSELNVGLLVGYARGANITNSSASGDITARSANVGGLVGNGHGATITSSYAYVGSVSGNNNIGGLVGWGRDATINSSYAAGGSVSGRSSAVGGLVGYGLSSSIISSYAADGSVSGSSSVGGLVGYGVRATITSSYSAGGSVRGTSSNVGGLVGRGNYATNIIDSYWDSDTSGITTGSYGLPKTTSELQLPTNTNPGIYANWVTDECDDGSDAWDFGTTRQYPALTCTPGGVAAQRR